MPAGSHLVPPLTMYASTYYIYTYKMKRLGRQTNCQHFLVAMEKHRCLEKMMILFLIGLISISCFSKATIEDGALETYIIFVQKPQSFASSIQPSDLSKWYRSFLPDSAFSSTEDRMVFSYSNVVTGFAAKLTAQEVKAMEEKEGFLSAFPDKVLAFHTTHTPSFLGLHQSFGLWNLSNYGKGQIIGLIDSGIAPDHPSFSDKGMPPPPAKWKGKCEFNGTVCNNKLIGARNFGDPGKPPFDDYMHGTHTASTAAGSPVAGANFFGQANGTAMGIAPLAHLAMYKCGVTDCTDSTELAAMDAAIEEGVDVLSLSLALPLQPFFNDSIAIAAFGAFQKGIFVSCSAGNAGPRKGSVRNDAPWILTVGASTVDRAIGATVLLGNQAELNGQSLFQPKDFPSTLLPLDYPGVNGNQSLAFCLPGSLKNVDIKGKIVLCTERAAAIEQGKEVRDNGGAGMIIANGQFSDEDIEPEYHLLPASHVSYKAGLAIKEYINSTASPMATILFKGTVIGIPDAPQVASFSSRGPSLRASGILKPDIIGPGVSVLAAWPVSYDNTSSSLSRFSMISGTSMSCPHLSGIAALLKSAHPDWSPAAIKSAIMTTADVNNLGGKPISDQQFVPATIFDMGAGHVNPSRANDPGLVYDIQPDDYIPYLCSLNFSDKEVALIVQHPVTCPDESVIPGSQLNYPSFSINLGSTPQTHTRAVTNVGQPNSVYTLEIISPQGVDVKVTPDTINFAGLNQKASYSVTFSTTASANGTFAQGHLSWKSDKYTVRSPIAVTFE